MSMFRKTKSTGLVRVVARREQARSRDCGSALISQPTGNHGRRLSDGACPDEEVEGWSEHDSLRELRLGTFR
jgi:hypothetical protein